MKIKWEETNLYYNELIAEKDGNLRMQMYRKRFIEPWKAMMDLVTRGRDEDELAGPRAWNWLLPNDFNKTPESLKILQQADAWEVGNAALEKAVNAMHPYLDKIGFDEVSGWLVLADPNTSEKSGRGYTGGCDFMEPRFVVQFDTPDDNNLSRLSGAVAHEFNHLIRLNVFPWDMTSTTVADYIVHEGLAESFAAELFGPEIVGHYATDISEEDYKVAKHLIGNGLDKSGFNIIRGYIFGDDLADKWGFENRDAHIWGVRCGLQNGSSLFANHRQNGDRNDVYIISRDRKTVRFF